MVHFVILKSGLQIMSIISIHLYTLFSESKNGPFCPECIFSLLQFCQKCSILSFSERPVDFFASSILSKMLNFVIFWEASDFFQFLSKMVHFVIFWNVDFKLWDKYKRYTMCTVCVVIYQTILSKMLNFVIFWETRVFFRFKISKIVLSKMLKFVIFWEASAFFSIFQFCQKWSILSFLKRGLQIMR